MIGQRLKIARAASGLSLRDLEAAIDNLVTAQAIGKYERNEDMPSSKVLERLGESSSRLGGLSSRERGVGFGRRGVSERRASRPSARKRSSRDRRSICLSAILTLEDALGLASVVWDRPREAPYPITDVAERRECGAGRAHALGPRASIRFQICRNCSKSAE